MISKTETMITLLNESFSLEYGQISCQLSIFKYYMSYFIVSCSIEIYLGLGPGIVLLLFMSMCNRRYYNLIPDVLDIDHVATIELEKKSSWIIIVIKQETKLIFIYIYVACLFTWFISFNVAVTFTYRHFLQWFIESILIHLTFLVHILINYTGCPSIFFNLYQIMHTIMIVVKIPLFILLRTAEYRCDFFINRMQLFFLHKLCRLI